jgi:hypothetical protein
MTPVMMNLVGNSGDFKSWLNLMFPHQAEPKVTQSQLSVDSVKGPTIEEVHEVIEEKIEFGSTDNGEPGRQFTNCCSTSGIFLVFTGVQLACPSSWVPQDLAAEMSGPKHVNVEMHSSKVYITITALPQPPKQSKTTATVQTILHMIAAVEVAMSSGKVSKESDAPAVSLFLIHNNPNHTRGLLSH